MQHLLNNSFSWLFILEIKLFYEEEEKNNRESRTIESLGSLFIIMLNVNTFMA